MAETKRTEDQGPKDGRAAERKTQAPVAGEDQHPDLSHAAQAATYNEPVADDGRARGDEGTVDGKPADESK